MRSLMLIIALLAALLAPLRAGAAGWFGGEVSAALANRDPRAYVEISAGTEAVGFNADQTGAGGVSAQAVRISVEGAGIRYREDGGDPTSTTGHYRAAGDEFILVGTQAITKFKAVQAGSSAAILRCTLYF